MFNGGYYNHYFFMLKEMLCEFIELLLHVMLVNFLFLLVKYFIKLHQFLMQIVVNLMSRGECSGLLNDIYCKIVCSFMMI